MDSSLLLETGIGAAAVVAVCEAMKKAGLPKKFVPLFSLIIAMALAVVWAIATGVGPAETIVYGLLFGGVASQGYDIVKKTTK